MSKLVARLNDGKGSGVEGTSVPYATLVACGNRQVISNRFDRLVQSGKSLPPSSKKNKKVAPSNAFASSSPSKSARTGENKIRCTTVKKESDKERCN